VWLLFMLGKACRQGHYQPKSGSPWLPTLAGPYFSNALALVLYLTLLKYQAGLGIGYFKKLAFEPSLVQVLGTL